MKTKLNVKLLRKIQKHILEEPKRFIMRAFLVRPEDTFYPEQREFITDNGYRSKFAECNTAACVGGWAVLLTEGIGAEQGNIRGRAKRLLGLPGAFDEDRLFEVSRWPYPFSSAYRNAKTQAGRARIAIRRIDHFIKTRGAE